MKKNKLAAAYKNSINYANTDEIKALKIYQRMERENNLKLLPTNDVKKLGVLYICMDVNGEIQISFFDRSKTTSTLDVMEKAMAKMNNIVGEDCLYYPAQIVGEAIVPNWKISSMFTGSITGTMDFSDFVKRMGI